MTGVQTCALPISEMASNRKEEVVLERRQIGKFVNQELGNLVCASAFARYSLLSSLGKELVWKLSQPGLEHRPNNVDIIEIILIKQIDIVF